jgi:acetylornithine deacetylase/succinyl-diaminopimelate desuccinylase-like protein
MSAIDDVVARINKDELVAFALEICNIDSAVGHERAVCEHLYAWMAREGFRPKKLGLLPDRFNLLGRLPGTGGGYSLLFNGHVDTAVEREFTGYARDHTSPEYHSAWVENDLLVGEGIVNDKGPVAAFLMAARAIKASGIRLKGDIVLTTVVAETSHEPEDETPGSQIGTKDIGARYLVTHGGIADYVLVAEGTGFGLVWVEPGKAWFKVTLLSDQPAFYTPYLPDRTTTAKSPNMIVAAAPVIEALESWAAEYQVRNTTKYAGGTVIPKVLIGGIRGGTPTRPITASQLCSLYLDVRTKPGQNPLEVQREICKVLDGVGVRYEIELYGFRQGHEARNIDRLVETVIRQHRAFFKADPPAAHAATSSMWRDTNIFNEVGIPAMCYAPRAAAHQFKRAMTIESLYQAACMYARIAVDLCNQERV